MKIGEKLLAGKFYLRFPTMRDAKIINESIRETYEDLRPWMFWATPKAPIENIQKFISEMHFARRKGTDFAFAIFDAATNEHVGMCGLHQINAMHRFGEIGYWVRKNRHRQGIAFAASIATLRFAFETRKLHKVTARANVENKKSLNLIRKLGFVKEGISRDDLIVHGKWGDHMWFSMLEKEYRSRKAEYTKQVPRKITI